MRSGIAWALLASAALAAPAMGVTYTFQIDVPNGQPVTDLVMYAAGEGKDAVYLSPATIAPSGVSTLTQDVDFDVSSALILGVNKGVDKTHIIMFSNDAFAVAGQGLKWSELFTAPSPRHNELITLLEQSHDGDAAALDAVSTFVRGEQAAGAAFDPSGSYSILQFSILPPPIGEEVPEPASLSVLGAGAAALLLRRRRAK